MSRHLNEHFGQQILMQRNESNIFVQVSVKGLEFVELNWSQLASLNTARFQKYSHSEHISCQLLPLAAAA